MANVHLFSENVLWKSAQIAATSTGNGTVIDTLGYENAVFVIHGVTAGASTIDAKVQTGANSNGSGMADITGAAITQIPASQTSKIATIEVRTHNQKRYLRCPVTIAGTSTVDVVCMLGNGRYKAPTLDTAEVVIV